MQQFIYCRSAAQLFFRIDAQCDCLLQRCTKFAAILTNSLTARITPIIGSKNRHESLINHNLFLILIMTTGCLLRVCSLKSSKSIFQRSFDLADNWFGLVPSPAKTKLWIQTSQQQPIQDFVLVVRFP
jgi:hypothetical protein